MTIDGFKIDEQVELNDNIRLLDSYLRSKYTFWGRFDRGLEKIRLSMGTNKVNPIFRTLYFLLLLPAYIKDIFQKQKTEDFIEASIFVLEEYYRSPKMRVVRFRAKCASKKEFYRQELKQLITELEIQEKNIKGPEIGTKTKDEIQGVLSSLREKIKSKQIKLTFYNECVEKLDAIETQIKVKESLLVSKKKLLELQDLEVEKSIKNQVEEELEIFKSYGSLLDGISHNLEKLRREKEDLFDLVEVKQIEEEFLKSKHEEN
jgi:hypothetical protein